MKIIDYSRRDYPKQRVTGPDDRETITAVLVGGSIYEATGETAADLAVYVGIGEPCWVAHNGEKQTYKLARRWFPDLKRDDYRD